jgi:predicted ATPase with chaperone activity
MTHSRSFRTTSCRAIVPVNRAKRYVHGVSRARARQLEGCGRRPGLFANAHMGPKDLKAYCRASDQADTLLKSSITCLNLSARAYHRVLKIARTVADLADAAEIKASHVSEAIQYRSLDRGGGRGGEAPTHRPLRAARQPGYGRFSTRF